MRKLQLKELNRSDVESFKALNKKPIICILDNVRSGLNVGSVFRTADAFAIESVYLCGITPTPPHREIKKTAIGASSSVHWEYFENPLQAVEKAKELGYKVYPIEQTTNSVMLQDIEIDLNDKVALVFGNEVNGVSDEVIEAFENSIEIPQYGTKHSFNISISVGIVLWEVIRKMKLF